MTEVLTTDEMKVQYPDQWILFGNPVMDADELQLVAGLPLLHSKDKKEICYTGREQLKKVESYMVVFTGQQRAMRRLTGIFNRIQVW